MQVNLRSNVQKKRQRRYYSGKKKRHTLKTQLVVDKKSLRVICTAFTKGTRHDFRLFKESGVRCQASTKFLVDTGYQGIADIHTNSELPKKRSKKHPLTKEDKRNNRRIASERVANEHVIGVLKRFRILAEKYRNRRRRFGLRWNLITGMYNLELGVV